MVYPGDAAKAHPSFATSQWPERDCLPPPGDPIKGFEAADRAWAKVRSDEFTTPPASPAVVEHMGKTTLTDGKKPEYDFVVCGGTLGIFVAASLQVNLLEKYHCLYAL